MSKTKNLEGLYRWRCIGPFRGGRVVAVSGSYNEPNTFYFGATAGGIWKTIDAGLYWRPVSDGFLTTSSIGAIQVAQSDSNVIYAGTGETTIRIDVSHGDGIYKSVDAGRTWQNIGLRETRAIGKIRIHPENPDIVWVAALGHPFGPNKERGIFKSENGGKDWRQVLYVSDRAGAVDLSLDLTNPRIMYASIWETYRNFWEISSGGPDSGLWQSVDGGETWQNISRKHGLPAGLLGKIGVAASPARPGRVWALIQHATEGGLYRSDDHGDTWQKVNDDQNLLSRAWYYTHVTADPVDPDTVYVNNLSFYKSTDAGKTFFEMPTPHGDNHDLWIDPKDNRRMIQANDGGANVSTNGGFSFSPVYNQPTAQFYHLATDNREPYTVYGTQQDNSSVAVPSRSSGSVINWGDGYIAGSGESGYIAVRPDNPNIVYVGAIGSSAGGGNCLQRYDHENRQIRLITTWPESQRGHGAGEHRYRFAWTYPIVISPHDPNVLYVAGNQVFKTTDEGQSWEVISPDLTKADPETLKPSGGPINRDAVGAETYATVFAFAESPLQKRLLWAGSDDGLLHVSQDGGGNWQNVTPPDFQDHTMVSGIEPSPFEAGTAYVAATRYKMDDYQPYLFVTRDFGTSWQRINTGIRADDFTRVIRTDPTRQGLLYAGTETGIYVSFDDGQNWQPFNGNLPVTPIFEILVKNSDLIVGTHGRSIWILDDLEPVRKLAEDPETSPVYLSAPRDTVRVLPGVEWTAPIENLTNYYSHGGGAFLGRATPDGERVFTYLDAGENPPNGAIITYWLDMQPQEPLSLTFKGKDGTEIAAFSSRKSDDPAISKEKRAPARQGWNRFIWDLRHTALPKIVGSDPVAESTTEGPVVAPGDFTVTLKVGETELSHQFKVVKPGNVKSSQADLEAQHDLLLRIHQLLGQTVEYINRMRGLRTQLDGWAKRANANKDGTELGAAAKKLSEQVLEIEKTLQVPDLRPGWGDAINQGSRLFEKLGDLTGAVSLGDYRPTDAAEAVFQEYKAAIEDQFAAFNKLVADDLDAFNRKLKESPVGFVLA